MDIENEESIDLSEVVRAVKQASDAELKVLAEISSKLSGEVQVTTDRAERRKVIKEQQRANRQRKGRAKRRDGEIELSASPSMPVQAEPEEKANVAKATNNRAEPSTVPVTKIEQAQSTPPESASLTKVTPPAKVREKSKPIADAIKEGMSDFSDFWKDEKGRLRTGNGRYASKDEKAAYEQSAASVAQERESEKEKGLVAKLISSAGSALTGVDTLAKNDAADTAGAAAGGSWFYAAKEMYQLGDSIGELASQVKEEGSMFDKAKGLLGGLFGKKEDSQASMIDSAKEQSAKNKQTALIQEQTNDQITSNEKIIDLLTEISDAKSGKGGLFDNVSIADMFGRGRGGFGGGRGGRGGKAGKAGKAGRVGRAGALRSVLGGGAAAGTAGAAAGGKKGLSIAGKAFKGVSTVAKGAGKLVPFLAPVLAAYDAFDGFTNTEKQKETFDLKEGQKATFGQKSAMAAANVLNLGGLVSGGAGLLGDALGAIGFDGAKEALSFDVGDMTKGIYDFFGGNDKKESDKEQVAKSQEETAKVQKASAEVSESATNTLTAASDKILKASENFLKAVDYKVKQPVFSSGGGIDPNGPEFMQSSPVKATVSTSSVDAYGVPAMLQRQGPANESVTQIQASNEAKKLKSTDKAQLVTLDEQSVRALSEANKVEALPTSKGKVTAKAPASTHRSVGVVPLDFSDGSLRRQSADLE